MKQKNDSKEEKVEKIKATFRVDKELFKLAMEKGKFAGKNQTEVIDIALKMWVLNGL